MRKIGSLEKIRSLGSFFRLAVATLLVVGPAHPALALDWPFRKTRVYVPVTQTYAVQNAPVAQAPAVTYSYAPTSYAPASYAPASYSPVAGAPVGGGFNGVYYAPMAGTQAAMGAPYMASSSAFAPQGFSPGQAFAPAGASAFGNVPMRIGDSRMTDEGRKDVLDDVRDFYRETKTSEKSRTALRKAVKEQATEKYVEVLGDDTTTADDLKDGEKKEILQIVDIAMREDPSANSASPYGNPNPYANPNPYPNPYPYGNAFAGQPYLYYFIYPIAPPAHPHHQHHLFHHQQ